MNKLSIMFAVLVLIANTAHSSSLPDFPFILVTGEAKVEVAPDKAKISFQLLEFSQDPDKALEVISKRSHEIIELAKEFDLPNDKIVSFGVNKDTRRSRNSNYQSLEILGYEVNQSFNIELENINLYPQLANKLIAMKNVTNIHAEFDVTNRTKLMRELVKKAGADAKSKADDLASGLGVTVKSVYAVNQDTSFSSFFATFGISESRRMLADISRPNKGFNMFIPKSIPITKTINVVYKIKP